MKKNYTFKLIAIVCLLGLSFTSCKDEISKENLIGEWKVTEFYTEVSVESNKVEDLNNLHNKMLKQKFYFQNDDSMYITGPDFNEIEMIQYRLVVDSAKLLVNTGPYRQVHVYQVNYINKKEMSLTYHIKYTGNYTIILDKLD